MPPRVLVYDDVYPSSPSPLHHAYGLAGLTVVAYSSGLVVGDGPSDPRPLTGLYELPRRLEEEVPLVAHVASVDPTVPRDHLQELHHLVGEGVSPGGVDEAGAQAEGAVLHRTLDHPLHLDHLPIGGNDPLASLALHAHHTAPNRAMAYERGYVNTDPLPLQLGHPLAQCQPVDFFRQYPQCTPPLPLDDHFPIALRDGCGRGAALAGELGHEAHRQTVLGIVVGQYRRVGVGVEVDEAWADQ